jgi:hypothetical protein
MSRSGYTDDFGDPLEMGRWRGAVASSIRGKRGQQLLKELAEAMDAMPEKKLIAGALETNNEYCALGVVGHKRGINLEDLDPDDYEFAARAFDIAEPLAREIVYLNDEFWDTATPEKRWERMRQWVKENLK